MNYSETLKPSSDVLVDATCLIALHNLGELQLLSTVFENRIATTPEVASEFGNNLPPFVKIVKANLTVFEALNETLDEGEASLIAVALVQPNAILILDEAKARKVALERKLTFMGTLGVLALAKEKGAIQNGKPYLQRLKTAGFRISPRLEQEWLKQIGEIEQQ